jgi:hypothetical protein
MAALGALRVDEGKLKDHVDEVVRSSVEETLNGLLDAEADQICRAERYERSAERVDERAGHYERKLETKAGEVTLRVPEAAAATVRDSDYRAVSAAVRVGRTSSGGDVPGGGIAGESRRHHRSAVGHASELWHGLAAEPERFTGTSKPGATARSRAISHTCIWMG